MAEPVTLSADDVEEVPSLEASDVEESAPKQYLPEVNQAVGSVPRPAVPAGLQPNAPPANPAPVAPLSRQNPKLLGASAGIEPGEKIAQDVSAVGTAGKELATAGPSRPIRPPALERSGALPVAPMTPEENRRAEVLAQGTQGAFGLALPAMLPAAVEAPLGTAAAFGAGYLTSKGTRFAAKSLGASPEMQDLAEQMGWLVTPAGLIDPKTGIEVSPEAIKGAASIFGGRAGVGVAVTPEEIRIRAGVGSMRGEKVIPRKPAAAGPGLEAPTIEGQVATPSRADIAEHLDRTNFESPEAAKASYVAEQQAQGAPVEAKAKAPEPEVIPPTKPAPAVKETPAVPVLESHQVEEATPKSPDQGSTKIISGGDTYEYSGGQFKKNGKVLDKSDDIADAIDKLESPRGKTIEGGKAEGTQPGAVSKPAARAEAKPELPSAAPVPEPSSEKTEAVAPAEQAAKPEIIKGGKVELADGRRATIEYAAPADKLPVVRLSTEDGEKIKLTSQKEIDGLRPSSAPDRGSASPTSPQGMVDRATTDPKALPDLLKAKPFNDKGLGGLDTPTQRVVMKHVVAALHDPEIRNAVVKLIPVQMMDNLVAIDGPADVSLRDKYVLLDGRGANLKSSVALRVDTATSLASAVAKKITELTASGRPLNLGRGTVEGSAAVRATGDHKQTVAEASTQSKTNVEPSRSPTGRLSTPEELAVQNQKGTTGVAKDIDKWQPPPELGAFPNTPDVGAKARAQVDKESGPLKRGEERRKVDRTGQQAEDKLFNQARKELGEDATTEQIEKRIQELRKPVVGSPEYEAIKAKIAKLETKPSPKKPSFEDDARARVSQRLRTLADNLDKQIEDKRRPMTQNPTPKRMAEYRSRVIDADEMERTQKAMRALADAHEAGKVPPELAGLRSKEEIGRLVHKGLDTSRGGYYDRIPSSEYRDKTPAGKKLQEMIEGAKSPEATAAKLAKEKASKIAELEADVQFRPLPGYFPTPKPVVEKMLDAADIKRGMSVLEPSAGKGNIADAIREKAPDAKLSVVEQAPKLQEILKLKDHNLVDSDFMEHDSHYDRIVMNPPFEKGADVEHVRHAFELLKPGGRLVAIMSPHAEFANDKKSVAFREWVDSLGGESEKLPESSFKESGTGVASRMVTIDKPEATKPAALVVKEPKWKVGDVVTFTKTAPGSYLKPNESYVVEAVSKNSVQFRNPRTGGGTSDNLKMLTLAEYTKEPKAEAKLAVAEQAAPRREVIPTVKKETVAGTRVSGVDGSEGKLLTTDGERPTTFRVVEAGSLVTSHDPHTFARNDKYPAGVQERAYDTSKEAQNRVIQQAQKYDPNYTINTNPDAVNGPPIITPDGIVLGGNSRAMSTARLYKAGNGNHYKGALLAQAATFGLDKQRIQMMKAPVLVREVEAPKTQDEMRALGSALNKSMTGALGVSERAVSAGKAISRDTLANISGMLDGVGKDASLRDLLRERGKDVLSALVKDGAITERERPQFVDTATGGLSEEGKTFVERALLGSVVDDPRLMDSTPKAVLNKLDGSLAALSSIAPRTDAYNILPLLREALREHGEIAQRGTNVEDYLSQSGLFSVERDPAVDALTRVLAGKSLAARERFRRFSEDANFDVQGQGTLGLIEQPSPAKAFNEAFGANLTDEDLENSILKAVQSEPTISANGGEAQTVRPAETGAGSVQRSEAREPRPSGKSGTGTPEKAGEAKLDFGPERIVPGARSSKTGNETGKTSIQDLTDSISRQVPEKRPLKDRISRGADIGEKTGNAKDSLGRAYDRIKGAASALWDAYGRPPKWTDYEDLTGKWSGADQINALDLERFSKAIVRAVPEKLRREAISNWIESGGDDAVLRDRADKSAAPYKKGYEAALNLSDAEKTIARNVMNRNDATLEEAQKAGILQQGVENYVRHVYADSPKYQAKVAAEMNFASLQTKPSFTKERKLPTYFDAEQLGFTPKDKDVGYLTAIHERSFREALAARAYVHALMHGKASDGRPLIATSWASAKELSPRDGESSAAYLIKPNIKAEEEFGDYRKLDHPALRGWRWAGKTSEGEPIFVQGDAIVHPEIFRKLKNNLTKSAIRSYETEILGHTVHPGAFVLNTSAEIKHAILSFSGFHQTTLAAHAAEHRTLPAGMPELDLNEPKQRKLVEHGLMVAQYDAEEAFGEGVASGGLVTKIPGVGPLYHHYTQYLFHSFLPRIKMGTSLNALDRNFSRYEGKLSDDQIYAITAAQGNASFGGLNYRMLGRNKTIQDVLRLGLMAPDFFEARARYAGQAAKPYGREQLVALVGGAVVIYTLLRMLNEVTDRDPHWDKPFSVVYRDKEYTMRTIQEDIFRAVTDPGKYFMNRLSPVVSTAIHLGEGRNAFGRKESVGEILKQTAKQEVPIPLQPWTRESKDTNAQKAVETIAKMVGVNMKNAHEASEERLRQKERAGRETEKELEDAAKAGDTATVEKIENDPEKLRLISEHETWAGYLSELRKLDKEIKDVKLASGISREDRRAYLDSLRDARKELLRQADEAAKQK